MKFRRLLTGAALALVLPLLLLPVLAHPGGTDSSGGHTDSSTGDYHYHHGYEAHEHEDLDGNGTIDCPFSFENKTGQSSGTSSGASGSSRSPGSSFAGSDLDPEATHETFSRLDLMLGSSHDDSVVGSTEQINILEKYPTIIYFLLALLLGYILYLCIVNDCTKAAWLFGIATALCCIPLIPLIGFCFAVAYVLWLLCMVVRLVLDAIKEIRYRCQLRADKKTREASKVKAEPSRPIQPAPTPAQTTVRNPSVTPERPHAGCEIPEGGFIKPDPKISFRPEAGPETNVARHTRCCDTCRYLWYETLLIRSRISPPLSSNSTVFIWTALFYTAVKTLRSQDTVDRIYAYFAPVTGEFVTEVQYRDLVVKKVQEVYRSIRPLLNDSDIDPRTANGRRDLWFLIAQQIPEGDDPNLQAEFEAAAGRIWQTVADVFPQAQPYPKAGDIRYSIDDLPEV